MRHGVLLALLAGATAASAHTVGLSRGDYRADGDAVRADVIFARPELAAAIPQLDADHDGAVSTGEITAAHDAIAAWAERGIVVRAGEDRCAPTLTAVAPTEQDGVALTLVHRCPQPVSGYSVRLDVLATLSLGHRHVATLTSTSAVVRGVLFEQQPELALAGAASWVGGTTTGAPSPLRAGLVRGFGVDHLLFLVVILAAGGTWHMIAARLLAFTLAHSLTFTIAALGYWSPPAAWIMPATALGIVGAGIRRRGRALQGLWRAAFLGGLAHGFGLAATLVAVVPSVTPDAVADFHAGIEGGQLALLLAGLSILQVVRTRRCNAPGVAFATRAASVAGACWFLVRRGGGELHRST